MVGLAFPLVMPWDIPGTSWNRASVVVVTKGRSVSSRVRIEPPIVGESVCTSCGAADTFTV